MAYEIDHDTGFGINDADFDFSAEFDIDVEFETRYIKPKRTKEIPEERLKYSDAAKLAKDIELKEGMRGFIVVNGSFYFGDFIEALFVEKGIKAKELTISTLSMNENNVDSLENLLNGGYVESLNLIVSDYFYSHEKHNLIQYMYKTLDKDNRFQLAAAGTHCKIAMFETTKGNKVLIHGSANLRSSGNIEQIVIEENKELYDFNYEYQNRILELYKTINKSIRHNKLWQTVAAEAAKDAVTVKQAQAKKAPPKEGA